MTTPYHGGDLAWARARYPDAPQPWIDLSTGINPWAYPFTPPPAESYRRLPGSALMERLRVAAAAYYGAPDVTMVVPAPGSQALIQWLPRLRAPGKVAVLGPTYGEHQQCWGAAGHQVSVVGHPEELESHDVAVVVNPNNPDGRALGREWLNDLARRMASRGGWLVVDEAFGDLTPELSLAADVAKPGRVVLRSFGKFFGLAGLRLGFALAGGPIAESLRTALGPWAVPTPAAHIAIQAFTDVAWIAGTRDRLREQAIALDAVLAGCGFEVVGGTDLFRLVKDPRSPRVLEELLHHGIFLRHFPRCLDWLRFGVPDERGMERLDEALQDWRD